MHPQFWCCSAFIAVSTIKNSGAAAFQARARNLADHIEQNSEAHSLAFTFYTSGGGESFLQCTLQASTSFAAATHSELDRLAAIFQKVQHHELSYDCCHARCNCRASLAPQQNKQRLACDTHLAKQSWRKPPCTPSTIPCIEHCCARSSVLSS